MVRGQPTQQNRVQTKTLETQALGLILPPPFSTGPPSPGLSVSSGQTF